LTAAALRPAYRELLAEMIRLPSISSADPRFDQGNRAVAELLAQRLEEAGFAVETMPLPYHPDKCNVLARRGEGEGGLVLSGHLDTVPCDEAAWSQDPFRLTERNGKLYGLGVCDMKTFFPIVFEALEELDLGRLQCPLYVLATADEESCMGGIRALQNSGRRLGRYALIGEPTSLVPAYAHKGVLMERLRLVGRSAHASRPELGCSALEGMHTLITALLQWRRELQESYRDEDFHQPVPTLNLGSIHGGDNANRVCGACELSIDIRLLPGMSPDGLRRELAERGRRAIQGSGLCLKQQPLFEGLPAMRTPPTEPIIRLAEELSGHPCRSVSFATEGSFLNAMGTSSVILGPGDIAQAHSADEYLCADRIPAMVRIVRGMVQRLCLQ